MKVGVVLLTVGLLAWFCCAEHGEELDHHKYMPVPGGFLMHRSCVHHVPTGSFIENRDEDGLWSNGKQLPLCKYPTIMASNLGNGAILRTNGWQSWTTFQQPQNETFTAFTGNFSVPQAPAAWGRFPGSAIVYIFTGLQNSNWVPDSPIRGQAPKDFEIIQPVLQYGAGSVNGGGLYWGIASWYVTVNSGAVYSDEVQVNPGDTIYGAMEMRGPLSWEIDSISPSGVNSSITISRPRLVNNPWAYCTLEVYNIQQCDWLPPANSPSHFVNMQLADKNGPITPSWTVYTEDLLPGREAGNNCGALFTVVNPATVNLQCQGAISTI